MSGLPYELNQGIRHPLVPGGLGGGLVYSLVMLLPINNFGDPAGMARVPTPLFEPGVSSHQLANDFNRGKHLLGVARLARLYVKLANPFHRLALLSMV